MIQKQFYKELGKYLYAVALSDGVIQEKEVSKLEKLVTHELKSFDETVHPLEQRELILTKLNFHNCILSNMSVKDARDSFQKFIMKYRGKITEHQLKLALQLIQKMAKAYGGENVIEVLLESQAENILIPDKIKK